MKQKESSALISVPFPTLLLPVILAALLATTVLLHGRALVAHTLGNAGMIAL